MYRKLNRDLTRPSFPTGKLATFALLSCSNAILWITFAPLASDFAEFYDVSTSWINWLSMSFMVMYLPGSWAAAEIIRSHGLARGLVHLVLLLYISFLRMHSRIHRLMVGALLNLISAALRLVSVLHIGTYGFPLALLGQILGGLSQPLYTNCPARVASQWFETDLTNTVTTIASMSNPIGIAMGQIMPLMFPTQAFQQLMITQLVLCFIGVACSTWVFDKRVGDVSNIDSPTCAASLNHVAFTTSVPVTDIKTTHPLPDMTSNNETCLLNVKRTIEEQEAGTIYTQLAKLGHTPSFRFLSLGFAIGLGLFNGLSSLIEALITPHGYTQNDASVLGGALMGGGLLGAAMSALALDSTQSPFYRRYKLVLRMAVVAAIGAVTMLGLLLKSHTIAWMIVSFTFLGFCMMPLLPIALQCAAQSTEPGAVSEEISSGVLMFLGNIFGLVILLLLQWLIDSQSSTSLDNMVTTPAVFLIGLMACCTLAIFQFSERNDSMSESE